MNYPTLISELRGIVADLAREALKGDEAARRLLEYNQWARNQF